MQYPNLLIKRRYNRFQSTPHLSRATLLSHIGKLALIFLMVILVHSAAMVYFENLNTKDALWLTLSTITTVGYGDLAAKTDLGRASTVLLIYLGGISLLAQLAAEYIDYRIEIRDRKIKGKWEWRSMKDHIIIINTPSQDSERYLTRLIGQIRHTPSLANLPIQILSRQFPQGLPSEIQALGAVHFHGRPEELNDLEKLNVERSKFILILAKNSSDPVSDSISFDTLDRLRALGGNPYIVAELVNDDNRARFINKGANSTIRPIRAYPEIVTRAFDSPGAEQILENLFTHTGDHPHRYDIEIDGEWSGIASKVISANIGTPLGFVDQADKVHTNPPATTIINAKALIILVHESKAAASSELKHALA